MRGFKVDSVKAPYPSENWGAEQERLSSVPGAHVRITSLRAPTGLGIEFLHYLMPILGARQTLPFEGDGNDGRTGRNSGPTCSTTKRGLDGNDPITGIVLLRGNLSMRCLTADECDRDMPHRRTGPSAMPMAFTGLDVYDITPH
jgi:hypothetical protein